MSETTLQIGTVLQGKTYNYRIEEVLGQGSFGITYKASIILQGELGALNVSTKVAIKEFFMQDINGRDNSIVTSGSKGGLYDKYKQKFAKEAINLSKLNHPNIIKVLESFNANNTVYYVMDYIDGDNLNKYINQHQALNEQEAIAFIKKIACAVSYMHSNKMLHLDIKPSNIMLRKNGEPILIDFGLSKQFDENGNPESSTSIGGGTPGYASIEQFNYRGGTTLPATMDVYALGATLFKMLTGKCPPEASMILNNGFPANMLQEKNVSDPTIAATAKAMNAIVANRYATVEKFISELPNNDDATIIEDYKTPNDDIEPTNIIETEDIIEIQKHKQHEKQKNRTIETIRWIDIKQFLDTIPYKTRYTSVTILSVIGLLLFCFSLNDDCWEYNIEFPIITLGIISIPIILGLVSNASKARNIVTIILTLLGTLVFISGYEDCWDYNENELIALLSWGVFLIAIWLGTATHSGIISKIYNIEYTDKPYRRIQNRHGKLGLCRCDKMQIKSLLPIRYNSIETCGEDAYICSRSGLTGLYNAKMRKMIIPLGKNVITHIEKDIVAVNHNGKVYKFTTKGYRVVED